MFHCWFNTAYVERKYLRFSTRMLDKACKDKTGAYSNTFQVEFYFTEVIRSSSTQSRKQRYRSIGEDDDDDNDDDDDDE